MAKTGYNGLYFDGGIRFVDQKHFCRKTHKKQDRKSRTTTRWWSIVLAYNGKVIGGKTNSFN